MDQVELAYNQLTSLLSYLTSKERRTIERAFEFARQAHRGQTRKSGEPYIVHPIAVAQTLARMQMDAETLAAALMHDVIEDTPITYREMEAEFGTEVAQLVLGVTKLGEKVKELKFIRATTDIALSYEERQAASLVNLFLMMTEDLRVMIIKLCDRLHNMRTLEPLKPKKRYQKAQETKDLFVPVAARLGIRRLECELDDLSLAVLEPETYAEIEQMLRARSRLLRRDLGDTLTHLRHVLEESGLNATVETLPEPISSLYRHIRAHGWDSARTYDGLRIEVLVETPAQCYAALGSVHALWAPVPGRISDFIAAPQDGLYRSLHTVVIGLRGHPLEVRIRTHTMKHLVEYGVITYFQQVEGQKTGETGPPLPWLNHLQELPNDDPETFLNLFRSEITPERIRVFTPKGDLMEMPVGSTPVDFAYAVHTEIGHRCHRALVNNRHVPLNRPLENGDQVEIVKSLTAGPDRRWLDEDLGYTQNAYTQRHIRRWFSHRPHPILLQEGRAIIEEEIAIWNPPDVWDGADPVDHLARQRGLTDEQFCLRVGRGEITHSELGVLVLNEALERPESRLGLLTLEIQSMDRPHLLRDACQIVADDNVNMHSAWARATEETGLAVVQLTLDAPNLRKIVRIAHRLKQMLSVLQVRRCRLQPTSGIEIELESCPLPLVAPADVV